eukprot:6459927-Amphidinium_carterae.1
MVAKQQQEVVPSQSNARSCDDLVPYRVPWSMDILLGTLQGWRWRVNGRDCAEAVIEHLVWLLYRKFAHYTFTIAAFRIVKQRLRGIGMKLQSSSVLLQFSWLM